MFDTLFSGFSKQLNDLRGQVSRLVAAIASKEAEITHLRTSPPPKADILDALGVVGAARGESARLLFEKSLQETQRRPLSLLDPGSLAKIRILTAAEPGTSPGFFGLECWLWAVFGAHLEAGVRRLIEDAPWPEAGPPVAERPAMIAKAEKELIGLKAQLESLREQAAAAGIILMEANR